MKKAFLILILATFITLPAFSQNETLTFTTYYPSPHGVYKELRSKRMAIGDSYYDNSQFLWDDDGSLGLGEIDQDADLVVEGNVGIGTAKSGQMGGIMPGVYRLDVQSNGASNPTGMRILGNESSGTAGPGRAFLTLEDEGAGTKWNIATFGRDSGEGEDKFGINLAVLDGNLVQDNYFIIDSTGNVGIDTANPQAKLDVAGGIRVGEVDGGGSGSGGSGNCAATGCTPDNEGTLRYCNQKMEYCDSNQWQSVGAGRLPIVWANFPGRSDYRPLECATAGGTWVDGEISIDVKEGDVVKVSFAGSVTGHAYGKIGLYSGNATRLASSSALIVNYGPKSYWVPLNLVAVYRANADGILSFRQNYSENCPAERWSDDHINLFYRTAIAEVIYRE